MEPEKQKNNVKKVVVITLISIFLVILSVLIKKDNLKEGLSIPINEIKNEPSFPTFSFNYKNSQQDVCTAHPEIYSTLPESSEKVTKDKADFLANTNISREYFDTHFTFDCANETSTFYNYTIGDYSVRVSVDGGEAKNYYNGLHEIRTVISKEDALKKLTACLGSGYKIKDIQLYGGKLNLLGTSNGMLGNLNLETGECSKRGYIR